MFMPRKFENKPSQNLWYYNQYRIQLDQMQKPHQSPQHQSPHYFCPTEDKPQDLERPNAIEPYQL